MKHHLSVLTIQQSLNGIFSKKSPTEISKNLHASSRHCLLSESEITLNVSVFKTYFIAEVNDEKDDFLQYFKKTLSI